MNALQFPDIGRGDELPVLNVTITEVGLMMYGAATWDWYRAHYDQSYAHHVGFSDVCVDGQQWGGYFARQLVDWLGPEAFIQSMKLRFKSMVFRGEKVQATGTVEDVNRSESSLTLQVFQEIRSGEKIASTAHSVVRVCPRVLPQ